MNQLETATELNFLFLYVCVEITAQTMLTHTKKPKPSIFYADPFQAREKKTNQTKKPQWARPERRFQPKISCS